MPGSYRNTYSFRSEAASPDAFEVVRFSGVEGLSRPYEFDILLMSSKNSLDLTSLVQNPATFSMKLEQGELPFHGIPALFELQSAFQGRTFYRAVLVPKLWWLTLTRHNQIFLDKDIQTFLTDALKDGGLNEGADFEFRLSKSYPRREYVCQYRESHFNFISRWMERDGLYYYFEQPQSGEKMIITDVRTSHAPMAGAEKLKYLPPSGLDWPVGAQSVKRFSLTRSQVPQSVTLTDYNYRKPEAPLKGESQVSQKGRGACNIYGEHFFTEGEAKDLAKIRAEELLCRETLFEGLSSVPHVRTGYLFTLQNHFRDAVNSTYLTIEARHEGGQEAYLSQALGVSFAQAPDMPYYRNTFTAIPANVQYRSRAQTEKPRFYGVMNARIDAAQSGQYADLDDKGRYKVILPFDLSGRRDGKASSWLRMNQPYGGSNMGFHFPLHKGCEVLLAFVDGDPDRPVIQAAAPNPEHKSLLTSQNNTKCMLTTSGGNLLHIEDREGSERMLMQSPTANSWVRCGQPNDPPSVRADDMCGWKLNTNDTMLVRAGFCNEIILGTAEWEYLGNYQQSVIGEALEFYGIKKVIGPMKFTEINFWTMIMRAVRQHSLGEQVALNDECVELAGDLNKLRENATKLEQLRNDLNAKRTTLTQTKQQLDDVKTALLGNKDTLTQEKTALTQTVQNLEGESQALSQAKQTLGEEKTTLETQKNVLTTQKVFLTANNLQTAEQIERLQAMRTEVAEMRSCLVGFRELG